MKLLTIVCLVFIAACGPKLPPTLSPEAKIAVRATQVTEALRATLPHIKALTCQPQGPARCIRPEDVVLISVNLDKAADAAIELGNVLLAVNEARDATTRTTTLQKASGILASIQSLLTRSILIPQGAEIQAALATVFTGVNALLFSVIWSA